MKLLFICGYLSIIAFVRVNGVNELPKSYKRCKMDSNFNQCMKDAINDAIPKIIKDYKELGLPKLQPFHIKKILFEDNKNGPVRLRQEYTNIDMPDFLEMAAVTDFKFDSKKKEFVFSINLPMLHIEGDYSISGKVLVLPIQGNGRFTLKFNNLKLRFNMKFEEQVKNGETYFHFTSVETFMKPEKMEVNFENLFNGDKALSDSTNQFMNENWNDIFTELEPDFSKFFSGVCLNIINKFYETRPIKNLFL